MSIQHSQRYLQQRSQRTQYGDNNVFLTGNMQQDENAILHASTDAQAEGKRSQYVATNRNSSTAARRTQYAAHIIISIRTTR